MKTALTGEEGDDTMKLTQLFINTALAASTVFANDHLTQIRDRAGRLGKEFRDIQTTLKDEQFSVSEVQARVKTIDGDLESYVEKAPQPNGRPLDFVDEKQQPELKANLSRMHPVHPAYSETLDKHKLGRNETNRVGLGLGTPKIAWENVQLKDDEASRSAAPCSSQNIGGSVPTRAGLGSPGWCWVKVFGSKRQRSTKR